MKFRFLPLGLVAALAIASPVTAQFPTNTGNGGPFADGALDPTWTVSTDFGATFNPAFVVNQSALPGAWQATYGVGSLYHWIAASSNASGQGPAYIFRRTFDLTGWNAATFSFSFVCAMDNFQGLGFLNGVSMGGAVCGPDNNFQFGTEHLVSGGFNGGVNTIDFWVSGDQTTDAFLLQVTDIDADRIGVGTVPEPATMGLLAIGLTALAGARRRRKA